MTTNNTFNEKELTFLLLTTLKLRSILFNCREMKLDPKMINSKTSYPYWKGKRGNHPLVDDLNKMLSLLRLHVNSEETIELYDVTGSFDFPEPLENNINESQ